MPSRGNLTKSAPRFRGRMTLRAGTTADVEALRTIEERTFTYDRLSARSFARFLRSPGASLIVAEADGVVAGYALTLFRHRSRAARLYSIAVDATVAGRKLGSSLLKAAEGAAL